MVNKTPNRDDQRIKMLDTITNRVSEIKKKGLISSDVVRGINAAIEKMRGAVQQAKQRHKIDT